MAVSLLLSVVAFVAAVALAGRANMAGRAERFLAATVIWLCITVVPTHALAWAHLLYPWALATSVVFFSAAGLVVSGARRTPSEHLRVVGREFLALLRMPLDGLRLLGEARSFVFLGTAVCAAMIAWNGWVSYLAPVASLEALSCQGSIVGYAIQNHGFSIVNNGPGVSPVNTLPRVCETMSLFFAMFGDGRLIELPSTLFALPLFIGVYVLARRYTADVSYAIGAACAVLLMPSMYLALRSTNGDVMMAALYVVGLHFATRPVLRLRDVWFSATALGLLLGTRLIAVGTVPLVCLVLAFRVFWRYGRARPAASAATILGAAVWLFSLGGPAYLRNWVLQGSPLWPWGLHVDFVHIRWPGRSLESLRSKVEFGTALESLLSTPLPGKAWPDTRSHGYGVGVVLLVPLGLLALAVALARVVRRSFSEGPPEGPPERLAVNLLCTAIPALLWLALTPDRYLARYNMPVVIVSVVATAWLFAAKSWLRVREAVAGLTIAIALALMYWATPSWGVSFETARELFRMSRVQRVGAHLGDFAPDPHVVAAREKELRAGDDVAHGDGIPYPAMLWNEQFSNRVVWIPSSTGPDAMLRHAAEIGAKWFVALNASPEYQALRSRTAAWQEVGLLSTTSPAMVAFRRVQSPTEPK